MISKAQVLKALSQVNDPELHRSLTDLKMVREILIEDGKVEVTIALTLPNCPLKDKIAADVKSAILALDDVGDVTVHLTAMTTKERQALFGDPNEGAAAQYNRVRRVVAVMSGKGGVGKSFVTGLLATALSQSGYQVGVLDADITGPSIPKLFGLKGPLEAGPVGVRPLLSQGGIRVMSFTFLLQTEDQPVIWRGPLIGKAITQLWTDVFWGDLDYLLVDLPPGTSDAALTTMQSLPVNGIIIVTTPQSLASMIVRKAVHMAQLVGVPLAGVVENMAYFVAPDTKVRYDIFGPSHTSEVLELANVPLLAQLPINPLVTTMCDAGKIEAVTLPETEELISKFLEIVPARLAAP
jgi:ATP-binding protein involved in chromosome partitioning